MTLENAKAIMRPRSTAYTGPVLFWTSRNTEALRIAKAVLAENGVDPNTLSFDAEADRAQDAETLARVERDGIMEASMTSRDVLAVEPGDVTKYRVWG
jgi:hypothetical protein